MRLTKRGKRVRAVAILIGVAAILWLIANVWWTGTSWCIGSMTECVGL